MINSISKRIVTAMGNKNIDGLDDLASQSSVFVNAITDAEDISARQLYRLAVVLGVSMEWLVTGDDGSKAKAPQADIDYWKKRHLQATTKLDIATGGLRGVLRTLEEPMD